MKNKNRTIFTTGVRSSHHHRFIIFSFFLSIDARRKFIMEKEGWLIILMERLFIKRFLDKVNRVLLWKIAIICICSFVGELSRILLWKISSPIFWQWRFPRDYQNKSMLKTRVQILIDLANASIPFCPQFIFFRYLINRNIDFLHSN